ncbi:hypothetical protein ERJ75_000180000 [Trypanosoma vivax]|nr:hypothetical protein ERJ75_000180000 [Trypanosoma vivax]
MMVLERVDSDLKSLETRLGDVQKTLSDSATELSGGGAINMQSDCTVLRAAAPLESAEYRADVLALFSGPLYAAKLKTGVNNTLREFVRVIRDLESVEEAVQIVMENVEGASVHVISANARAAQAGDGATQARKMADLSAMESKKAQEEILSEEASAVCGLVRQLGSLKSQFTSLRKEALVRVQSVIGASTETDLAGDTEKLSVSNEHSRAKGTVELVGTAGSETARPPSTVAEAVETADKAVKDISGLLEAVSKRLSSITVNMGDPEVDVSDCALFGGSVTEDSLVSAAARYARLVSSGGRLHTEGGLRDELVKWLRQLKACGETVLRTGGAEMKTSGMRMAPDTLDSTDATTSGPEAASEGDEARVAMSANTPVQDKRSGNILTWILMSSTPLLLLVVLVFILIRRLGKQEKCEEFECIKQLPIARSRAESFEYISHVPSEASDDALAKSCEIELDMAGGW